MMHPYRSPSTRSANESGEHCVLPVLTGEALRNVARQHGIDAIADETDEALRERIMEVFKPARGRVGLYP
jgi:hypothetical protein